MKNKKLVSAVVSGLVFLVIVILGLRVVESGDISIDESKLYRVSEVVDGDTIRALVDGREITVRLLGINTPETVDPRKPPECFGAEASSETKTLLTDRQVRLLANPNRELKDKYKRYLLYVYRDDGLFVNETLLQGGFAREYTYGKPYSMQKEFRAAEKEAVAAKRGLWGNCEVKKVIKK